MLHKVRLTGKVIRCIYAYMLGDEFLQSARFRILGKFPFVSQLQQVFFSATCPILNKFRMRPDVACDCFRSNYLISVMP